MAPRNFRCQEHVIPAQHIRHYYRATHGPEDELQIAVKEYIPIHSQSPRPGDATVIARAFTDDHGRYLLSSVLPGRYRLRASAAFLQPATREDLRLGAGARAIANLTMSALFEAGSWLPAQKRRAGEPSDDWQWMLRSTANRPLLRLAGEDKSANSQITSSSAEHGRAPASDGEVVLMVGDEVVDEIVDVRDEPRFEEIARWVPVEIRRAVSFRPMREI